MSDAAILLSGGMDSIALAYRFPSAVAITVDYGQMAAKGEVRAAESVAGELEMDHELIRVDLRALGSGDLAGMPPVDIAPVREWWPFRNQMLVTLAAMRGVELGVSRVLLGTVKDDSEHADGTREFVAAMDAVLRCQEGGIRLDAPAIDLTAVELVRWSKVPIELLAYSHSCHVSDFACGVCRGCHKHYHTLKAIGASPY